METIARIARFVLVAAFLSLVPLAAFGEATLVVSTALTDPLQISVVTPAGKTLNATTRNGIGYLTLPDAGSYTLTLSTAKERESATIAVPRAGTVSVFFDPRAAQKVLIQPVTHGEAITVTAPKREELLQRVPMSIDAITTQEIDSRGATEFSDVAREIPSVTVVDRGPTQTQIVLRGISPIVGASTVGYNVDGLSLSANFNQPDVSMFDVERVEVLRGPQGTLYGEGSMGGNINIITNKADATRYDQKFDIVSSTTNEGGSNHNFNGMINLPLIEDRLALRVTGNSASQSGFVDNRFLGQQDINDTRTNSVRAAARWILSDRALLTVTADYQKAKLGGPAEVNAALGQLTTDVPVPQPQSDRINLYSLEFNYDLGWSDLTFIGGAMLRDSDVQLDAGLGPDYPGFYNSGQQTVSTEFRLASKRSGPLTWVGGLFLKRWDRNNTIWTNGFPVAPGFVTKYIAAAQFDTETAALFGEANYALSNTLTGTVGLRAFEQREHDFTMDHLPDIPYVLDDANLRKTFRDVSPKFGLAWQRTPTSLYYANIAKGYRAGGTNTLHATNPGAPLSYDADVVWSYEAGLKHSSFDGRIVTNGALFYSDWNNLQILGTPENSLLGYTTNAGRASSRGIELEVHAHPVEAFDFGVGATWSDAVLKEAAQGGVPGNTLPFVPKIAYSANVRYERPAFAGWDAVARADYSWRDKSYRDVTNTPDTLMPSYGLANVRAGLESGLWSAYLFVNNVTDVRAELDRNAGYVYRNIPRTVGVNIRVNH